MDFLRRSQQTEIRQPLGGRYRVISQLGVGGFSQTFLAEDLHLPGHPRCVVKQLKPQVRDATHLQTARRLFDTEAKVLYQLGEHNQIPRLLAHFEENQEFYLVQELIVGEPLTHRLSPGQRWTEHQVIALLKDILTVLTFVHEQNVIHRDIKPSNLICRNRDGKIVLIDFGAVKRVSTQRSESKPGEAMTISIGTQGYMAIEQLSGNPRFNSDIYAAGIIGIQALTGVHPKLFERSPQTGELEWQNLTNAKEDTVVQVSPELAAILDRMVRFHFNDRYQTAAETLQALESLHSNADSSENIFDTEATALLESISRESTAHAELDLHDSIPAADSPQPRLDEPQSASQSVQSPAGSSASFSAPASVEKVAETSAETQAETSAEQAANTGVSANSSRSSAQPAIADATSAPAHFDPPPQLPSETEATVSPTSFSAVRRLIANTQMTRVLPTALSNSRRFAAQTKWRSAGWVAVGLGIVAIVASPILGSLLHRSSQPAAPASLPALVCRELSPPSLPSSLPSGKPNYRYSDGTRYYGPLKHGLPATGKVTMIFSNGSRYDGEFRNGKRNGCGMLTFPNGRSYVGQFKDDKFDGLGIWKLETGDRYVGTFKNNRCEGKGTFVFASGTFKQGDWRDGNLVGGDLSCNR